jgi:hypothetical protein
MYPYPVSNFVAYLSSKALLVSITALPNYILIRIQITLVATNRQSNLLHCILGMTMLLKCKKFEISKILSQVAIINIPTTPLMSFVTDHRQRLPIKNIKILLG